MAASLTPDAVGQILGGNLDLKPVMQCTGTIKCLRCSFVTSAPTHEEGAQVSSLCKAALPQLLELSDTSWP